MRKKYGILLILFSFIFVSFFSFTPHYYNRIQAIPITSGMYGESMDKALNFSMDKCDKQLLKIDETLKKLDKIKDEDENLIFKILKGIANLIFTAMYQIVDGIFDGIFDLLLRSGCALGIAPNQLMQLAFFPIVLDHYDSLESIIGFAGTIAILILCVTSIMSFMEMKKTELDAGEELIQKIGLFLISVGLISFSTFFLQGIFDIANALSYFVSNYKIDYPILQWAVNSENVTTLPGDITQFPALLVKLIEFSFEGSIAETVFGALTGGIAGPLILLVIKAIVYFFIFKDMFKIAMFGVKRILLLFSAAVITPIMAALIPSRVTIKTFTGYFKGVVASAFVPAVYGLMLIATSPMLINILNEVDMPLLLNVIFMALYCNVMASIPEYIESILGADTGLRPDPKTSVMGRALAVGGAAYAGAKMGAGHYQGYQNAKHQLNQRYAKAGATTVGPNGQIQERKATFGEALKQYGKNKVGEAKYGQKLYYKARIHQGEEDAATQQLKQQEDGKRRERSQMFNQANFVSRPISTQNSGIDGDGNSDSTSGNNPVGSSSSNNSGVIVGGGSGDNKGDSSSGRSSGKSHSRLRTVKKPLKVKEGAKLKSTMDKGETASIPLNVNGKETNVTIKRPHKDNPKQRAKKKVDEVFKRHRNIPKRNGK